MKPQMGQVRNKKQFYWRQGNTTPGKREHNATHVNKKQKYLVGNTGRGKTEQEEKEDIPRID